jgi:hypothetical protein
VLKRKQNYLIITGNNIFTVVVAMPVVEVVTVVVDVVDRVSVFDVDDGVVMGSSVEVVVEVVIGDVFVVAFLLKLEGVSCTLLDFSILDVVEVGITGVFEVDGESVIVDIIAELE